MSPTIYDVKDENRLTRLEVAVLGVTPDGEGGLVSRVSALEQKVNTLSLRLILFIGVGSAVIGKGTSAILDGATLLAKHMVS